MHLPISLWIATFAEALGFVATTVYAVYRGVRVAGAQPVSAARTAALAALALTAWFTATGVLAAHGDYRTRIGHGVPLLPLAFVGTLGSLLLLTRLRPIRIGLEAPGALARLMWPHTFRIGGAVFVIAMLLNKLPALFAIPAGVGDMVVAVMAPIAMRRFERGTDPRGLIWFSVAGMADLISALTLGALTGFQIVHVHPTAGLNSQLPLALIPTAGVPLLMALHITTLRILFRSRPAAEQRSGRNSHRRTFGAHPVRAGQPGV